MFILDCTLDCKYIQSTCNRKWTDKRLTANICYFRCFSLSISIVLCAAHCSRWKNSCVFHYLLYRDEAAATTTTKNRHTLFCPPNKNLRLVAVTLIQQRIVTAAHSFLGCVCASFSLSLSQIDFFSSSVQFPSIEAFIFNINNNRTTWK